MTTTKNNKIPLIIYILLLVATTLFYVQRLSAAEPALAKQYKNRAEDPHYTTAGFFDIHVCNWPNRKLFFMPLFSTERYMDIDEITVYYPDGSLLVRLGMDKYKLLTRKNKPEKRVYISQIDVTEDAPDGWYTASVRLNDDTIVEARDYVIISSLPRPVPQYPDKDAEQVTLPVKLSWTGAKNAYYQVFVRDVWNDNRLIYQSKLTKETELTVPDGLLQRDGFYSWQIHARDVNEDPLLGDFNQGAMSKIIQFTTDDK